MNQQPRQARRIGIVGAGAIGGYLAARLALAGHQVSMLARNATLQAISEHGLRYSERGQAPQTIPINAYREAAQMGPQDLLVIALKSQALPGMAAQLMPLLQPETVILPIGNGLPWWYFLVPGQALSGLRLRSVDPAGEIERVLPFSQVLGGSVGASCACPEPGRVVHHSGERVVLGEPLGGASARAEDWAGVFKQAGLAAIASENIRLDIWLKLLGNACANPLSLITGASTDRLLADPGCLVLFKDIMNECIELGERLGLPIEADPDQRIEQTRKLGAVKTSMLQDLEAGRGVELDAILGAPLEAARQAGLELPKMNLVFTLARLRARQSGLYPTEPEVS